MGRIRGECCKCFLSPPHRSPPHHHHHRRAWLLNWLIQSWWSDLALLRCETISSGPPRPPTATDPQPHPPRSLLQPRSSRGSLPRRRGKPKAPSFSFSLFFGWRLACRPGPRRRITSSFPRRAGEGKSLRVLFIDSAATLQSLM